MIDTRFLRRKYDRYRILKVSIILIYQIINALAKSVRAMKVILIVCRIRLSQGNRNKIQKSLSCMHIAFIYLVHATSLLLL